MAKAKTKTSRINKSKEQLKGEMQQMAKVAREKQLVKLIFPILDPLKTIYDAQTTLGALAGFIKAEMEKKIAEVNVKDLGLISYLEKEKNSEIKTAIITLIGQLELEKAKEMANLLERFGNILAQYSANEYMKRPMTDVKVDQIISS